jgi:hypothetical protein
VIRRINSRVRVVLVDERATDVRVRTGNIMLIIPSEVLCVSGREKEYVDEVGELEQFDKYKDASSLERSREREKES